MILEKVIRVNSLEQHEFRIIAARCASLVCDLHVGFKGTIVCKIRAYATTYSGHATRTTVGNTWRCYLRVLLVCAVGGVTEIVFAIGGDDQSHYFLKKGEKQKFEASLALLLYGTLTMPLGLEVK